MIGTCGTCAFVQKKYSWQGNERTLCWQWKGAPGYSSVSWPIAMQQHFLYSGSIGIFFYVGTEVGLEPSESSSTTSKQGIKTWRLHVILRFFIASATQSEQTPKILNPSPVAKICTESSTSSLFKDRLHLAQHHGSFRINQIWCYTGPSSADICPVNVVETIINHPFWNSF